MASSLNRPRSHLVFFGIGLAGCVTLTGSDPAMLSSSPCSSFASLELLDRLRLVPEGTWGSAPRFLSRDLLIWELLSRKLLLSHNETTPGFVHISLFPPNGDTLRRSPFPRSLTARAAALTHTGRSSFQSFFDGALFRNNTLLIRSDEPLFFVAMPSS
jgi:hypothetical protein